MKIRETCDRILDGIVFVQKKITGTLLLVMIFTVSWQIIGRVLLKINTPWTEELAKLCLIWFTFLGSIGGLHKGEHLTVDLLLARYKPETRAKVNVFIYAIISAFCIMLFVFGVGLCNNPIIRRGVTTGLNISRLWLYMSLPISMFFSSLIAVYKLITATVDLVKGGKGK